MVAEKKGEKNTVLHDVKSREEWEANGEKRTVRSEFNVQSVKCPGSRSRSLPRCRMTGPGTRPLSGAARWAQCRSCWREREKQKVGQPPDILRVFSVPHQDRREKKQVARWKVSALHVCADRCAAATSSPRKRGSSPGGTHKKPGEAVLIQQARGCRVIKPLFSGAISQQQTLPQLTAAPGGSQ